jgi:hypothetical protein
MLGTAFGSLTRSLSFSGFEIQQPRLSLLIKIEHDDQSENDGAWLTLIFQTIASANDLPGRLGIV